MRHVPHLLVPGPWGSGDLPLRDDQLHHLGRVLRLGDGADLSYTDGSGTAGRGTLNGSTIVRGSETPVARPHPEIAVAAAPPRAGARQRFIVEKLAELGVDRLIWLDAKRGEGKPPRIDKAEAWAAAALEQSRGSWLMHVSGPLSVDELPDSPALYVAERETIPPPSVVDGGILMVGPEAGFVEGEVPVAARRLHLGARVLRVETAVVVGATLMLERSGRLGL